MKKRRQENPSAADYASRPTVIGRGPFVFEDSRTYIERVRRDMLRRQGLLEEYLQSQGSNPAPAESQPAPAESQPPPSSPAKERTFGERVVATRERLGIREDDVAYGRWLDHRFATQDQAIAALVDIATSREDVGEQAQPEESFDIEEALQEMRAHPAVSDRKDFRERKDFVNKARAAAEGAEE